MFHKNGNIFDEYFESFLRTKQKLLWKIEKMSPPTKHTGVIIKRRDLPRNELPTLKQLLAYYYYQKEIKNK